MTMPRPSLVTVENYDTLRESIPSFFMREISVVRLTSIRIAAPLGPATRPCVSSSTRRISSRSLDSRGLDVGTAAPARLSSRPELQERCREFKRLRPLNRVTAFPQLPAGVHACFHVTFAIVLISCCATARRRQRNFRSSSTTTDWW